MYQVIKKTISLVFIFLCITFLAGCKKQVVDLSKDGTYYMELTMEGGSGKVTIESPAKIEIVDDACIAYLKWSSSNYDYMIVDGKKYLPINEDGNSEFAIPISKFDTPINVIGDTVAMSVAHEIEYSITFHSENTMVLSDTPMARAKYSVFVAVGIICLCIVVSKIKKINKKKRMAEMMKND